jgi:hypothetical protein
MRILLADIAPVVASSIVMLTVPNAPPKTILPLAVLATTVVVVAPTNGRTVIVPVYPLRSNGTLSILIVNKKLNVVAWLQTKLYLALKLRSLSVLVQQLNQR